VYPIAEFRTATRRAVSRLAGTLVAAVATAFLGGVTLLHLEDRSPDWDDPELVVYLADHPETVAYLAVTTACVVSTLAFGTAWLHARSPLLRCPHCRGRLTGRASQVLASGCCHFCGRQVLERTDEPADEALIPRAELLTADARHQRRTAPLMLGAVAATVIGSVAGAKVLDKLDLPDPTDRILYMLLLLTAPVAMVLVLRWMAAGAKRDPSLACPECGQPLTGVGKLVAGTGHCCHCGGRAVPPRVHPIPPPHAGAWWTVGELSEADRGRRRLTRRALVLVGAVCVAALWVLSLGDKLWDDRWLMGLGLNRAAADLVQERAPLGVAVVTVMAGAAVSRSASRRAKREHPLDCPRCVQEIEPTFAIATKCCNKCGWRVVSDPADDYGSRSATRTTADGWASGETESAGPKVRCVR
jgi:hypothetical protein